MTITDVVTRDRRFELKEGAGADAVHTNPQYAYAVCRLETGRNQTGNGLAFTLGEGNDLVCKAIEYLAEPVKGKDIEEVMENFGTLSQRMSDAPGYRWLGPHKGVVHLALAAITNACFDLWAKQRQQPLWKLLLDLSPQQTVKLLDLRYLEDVLTEQDVLELLRNEMENRESRKKILDKGYPGYDTSVGWFSYPDAKLVENARKAVDAGFGAMKLKVGSDDPQRDLRRAFLVRETVGDDVTIMLDVNQQWSVPEALKLGKQLQSMDPYWIEEPTDPDDVLGHQTIAKQLAPVPVALGEHVPNKVLFKNFMQAGAMRFNQVDAVRVGGVAEFLTVSILSKKFGIPVVPHVGDMGQIHQHLVLYNHIALGHEVLFLEYIPHLREYFKHPAIVEGGRYHTPQEPGASTDLIETV
ncbi:enolase C-terminal domain-like protein [Halalkalibaculum sp. DA3122]|uniref:enolase C-terminal domain-like protein n=1 Tax=unclassified Halalkalibaculum TaxID=2964617 RepID=UPI003754527C